MLTTIIGWLIVGGISGWLASLILRSGTQQGILLNILVGIIGAAVAGAAFGKGSISYGFSMEAFLWSLIGAIVLLAILNLTLKRRLR